MAGYFKEVYLLDNIRNIWLFKSNPKVGSSHTTTPLPHPHQKKKEEKEKTGRKEATNNPRVHSERPIWSCDFSLLWKGNNKSSKGSWLK